MTQQDMAPEIYDPYDAATRADPYPTYKVLRDEYPVYHNARHGFWALSRFADVLSSLLDVATFSSAFGIAIDRDEYVPDTLTTTDPPRQTQLRALVSRGFTARQMTHAEDKIREIARELLENVTAASGTLNLMKEFAAPLPTVIIAEMIGVPRSDQHLFRRWSDDTNAADLDDPQVAERRVTAFKELNAYFFEVLRERRAQPRDDIMTSLAQAEIDGVRLTDKEVVDFAIHLLFAGNETTAGLIGGTVVSLAEHPDQRELLVRDPALIGGAVEEFLRFGGSVHLLTRTTTREVSLHGQTIPEGAVVAMLYAAANRDEREFENADTLDVTRTVKRHLAFDYGAHFCLGAALARLETRIAFEELLRVAPHYEIDAAEVHWHPSLFSRSPEQLPFRVN